MNDDATQPTRGALVLGARNLGGAIAGELRSAGWQVAAVSRTDDSLRTVERGGIAAVKADVTDPMELRSAIEQAVERFGRLDAIVNAVSASRPPDDGKPFGGGPLGDATLDGFDGWTAAVARQAFVFLSVGMASLQPGGTLVQVTGGSARRANPGRGLWAAGSAAVRALTQAAALEGKDRGIHAALLIVDGVIGSPKTAAMTSTMAPEAVADQDAVARAAVYLAEQVPGAQTPELQVTPAGDRWLP